MKKTGFLLWSLFSFGALVSRAQIKIGTDVKTMHPYSLLELQSDTQGVLFVRMDTATRDEAFSRLIPPVGLFIFNTDSQSLEIFTKDPLSDDMGRWVRLSSEDFLQPGIAQAAAGYVIYGSSTMLVFSTGNGVHGFTYDSSLGIFCLSHPNMTFPDHGQIYSVNEGNYVHFHDGVKQYIKYCQVEDKKTDRPYSSRYIGSLVSDFHRNLIMGGIFLYPASSLHPLGKLRLLYECNPMAFLAEQAGGVAISGADTRVLDINPTELHQRVPFFVGSKHMVKKLERFLREFS